MTTPCFHTSSPLLRLHSVNPALSPCRCRCRYRSARWRSSLIAVAGATGGVGRLVIDRLLSSIITDASLPPSAPRAPHTQAIRVTGVRALCRDANRARAAFKADPALSIVQTGSTVRATAEELRVALQGVAVLVICTGTTAIPTRAWRGGNTPNAVDDRGVLQLVQNVDEKAIRRVVLLSSIGTMRAGKLPFVILNSFGVLDAKRRGEVHVQREARRHGFAFAIVRPGQLVGAPHTNVGMLKSEPHPRRLGVCIAGGDTLTGKVSRAAAADAVFFAAKWDPAADLDLSLVHCDGGPPAFERWESMLRQVQTVRCVAEETHV